MVQLLKLLRDSTQFVAVIAIVAIVVVAVAVVGIFLLLCYCLFFVASLLFFLSAFKSILLFYVPSFPSIHSPSTSPIHPFTLHLTHPSTHAPPHPSIHSPSTSPIHPLTLHLTHPSTHPPPHPSIHSPSTSPINPFTLHLTHQSIYLLTPHLFIHPPPPHPLTSLFSHPSISHPIPPSIHLSLTPSIHSSLTPSIHSSPHSFIHPSISHRPDEALSQASRHLSYREALTCNFVQSSSYGTRWDGALGEGVGLQWGGGKEGGGDFKGFLGVLKNLIGWVM